MQQVKKGDTVRVHYQGRLTDESIFDSSEGRDPLEFVVGEGQVIRGFDEALLAMQVGDKKTVHIPVENAYGLRDEDMVMNYPISDFPADMKPEIGMELQLGDDEGNIFHVVVIEVGDEMVILDANHPLAGEDLVFEIELVGIA